MEKRILRLEDEFWRIRTDTGELADAERDALRACLDGKGFKTAMIDDNLAIAGELSKYNYSEIRWRILRVESVKSYGIRHRNSEREY
jgi:hypothetical protein